MPAIKASATGRIGDENYTGVITKTVLDALNGIFMTDTLRLSLKRANVAISKNSNSILNLLWMLTIQEV